MPISERDKRILKIGGVVIGVLLVGFLLFNLLSGGGGTEEAATVAPLRSPTSSSLPSVSGTPTLTPSPVLVLPLRDPFSIPPGFSVTSTTSGTTTSSGGSTTTSTGGTTTTSTGGTTTTTAPGQPGNDSSDTIGGHTVVLITAFTANGVEQAQVSVDGTVYNPSAGESFGPNNQYRLQSVSGNCATFLFGDESFTLCVAPNK